MNQTSRALLAIVVAAIMVVTLMPVSGGSVSYADPAVMSDAGSFEPVTVTDRGNDLITIDNPFLEDFFGLNPDPLDVPDPLGGMLEIIPQEIVYYNSNGSATTSDVYGDVVQSHGVSQYYQRMSLAAALTKSTDGVYGTDLDWYISLYFSEHSDGRTHLTMRASNWQIVDTYTTYTIDGEGLFTQDYVDTVSTQQAGNILQYAVGDYDGDGNEEVAVHFCHTVFIMGMDNNGDLQVEHEFQLDEIQGKDNELFTPVSMTSIDYDDDDVDELVVARSYYEGGTPGRNEITRLYLLGMDGERATWDVTSTEVDGARLDAVMVSVADADVDADGYKEIMIGGYFWDNTRTGKSHTEDWAYRAGELFLAYIEPDELASGNTELHSLTILGDDDGTSSNSFGSMSHHDFDGGHNEVDTSIYTTDDFANPLGLTRATNWCNWTIPLEGVKLNQAGDCSEQVFFNNWFYELDGDRFSVYKKVEFFTNTPDDNNVMCNYIDAGLIWQQDSADFDGIESLFISYSCNLDSHYSSGRLEWCFVILDDSDGEYAAKVRGDDIFGNARVVTDTGMQIAPVNSYLINQDHDAYLAEFLCHVYTYTDPTVIAVVSAVPYDQDLASVLISGADSIGATEFERYTETGQGESTSASIEVGPAFELERRFFLLVEAEVDLGGGYSHEVVDSHTQTIEYSTAYESAEDAVAMYVIPTDVYLYTVYESDDAGNPVSTVQGIHYFHQAVDMMVGYEDYVQFMEGYNETMSAAFEDFTDVPIADPYGHTQGDISTYDESPSAPIASATVSYRGAGTHGTVSQGIDLSEETEHAVMDGFYGNMAAQVGTHRITGGAELEFEYGDEWIQTDASGMAFTSTMSNGMEVDFIGEPDDSSTVLSQYTMEGEFWAEMRSATTPDGSEISFVYIGYTVDHYTTAAAMADLTADVYIPDGTDEDDPYNPTSDTVYLMAGIPGVSERDERNADYYSLQIQWQGRWYDINSVTLGIEAEMQAPDGTWTVSDRVSPSEAGPADVWFRVSGLDSLGYSTFDFRIVAHRLGSVDSVNPSLPVTAYLDLRAVADSVNMVSAASVVGGTAYIDSSHTIGDGIIALIVEVGDTTGPLDLVSVDQQGNHITLGERLSVYAGGYLIHLIQGQQAGEDEPEVPIGDEEGPSVAILAAGVVVAMVVVGLVMRQDD